jgi:nitroreductase
MNLDLILTRRSIRQFSDAPVDDQVVTELLNAAMAAPSAGNQQPWHFIVIRSHDLLDQIPKVHPHAKMVEGAQLAVLVCGDLSLEVHKGFWIQDCSAATENLLLAANAKGLGAVWVGVYPREDRMLGLRGLLGIPEQAVPFALIPIGYPLEPKEPAQRFNPERIHRDKW